MWIKSENVNRDTKFPSAAGVYVVYLNRQLYYIGSAANLEMRLYATWKRKTDSGFTMNALVDIKYSVSKKYGDWLMREIRLIRKLQPRANKVYNRGVNRSRRGKE